LGTVPFAEQLAVSIRNLFGILRSLILVSAGVGLVVGLVVLGIRQSGRLEQWELSAYDWMLGLQPDAEQDGQRVLIIGITEHDLRQSAQWPLTDGALAEVLEKLARYEPRAIGVDIYRNFSVPPGQHALEAVLRRHHNIIMVMKFGSATQDGVAPLPMLEGTQQVGFNDLIVDRDGIVRRGLLFLDDSHQTVYSFPLRLALLYLQKEAISPQPDSIHRNYLRLGRTTFLPLESNDGPYISTDARGYQIMLDFRQRRSFQTYPLRALLANELSPDLVRDKVVLIGVVAESLPDVFHTPATSGLIREERGVYGVVIHAHLADQLIEAALGVLRPLENLSEDGERAWVLFWGAAGGFAGIICRSMWRSLAVMVTGLLLLGSSAYVALKTGWWIPVVPPATAWLVSVALITAYSVNEEKRQRAFLMQLFQRHMSPEVAEAIWQQRDQFWDGARPRSQQVVITVIFTDLEGFTSVAEKMDPEALMKWTNRYTETMAQVVMQHGGVVDDYFGDAIKANFGVPVPRTTEAEIKHDAIYAANCALSMDTEMRKLNERLLADGFPAVRMRVGIYTGIAVAGSQGSANRLKYTTIGDAVNIAARLESFDKEVAESWVGDSVCRILIGESTYRYLGPAYVAERIGELQLKGKVRTVTVYRLIRHMGEHVEKSVQGGNV
jgi:adenylate cyclase